jgi:exopolysaccharide biosynthesis protein
VENGKQVKNLATSTPSPRTALGVTKNGKGLILMVVDGRQPGYSDGVTFPELAQLMISHDSHTAINMDGGGSSTLVIEGRDGNPVVLNSPIDQNVPGAERAVANHLGIFIQK